MNQKNLPHKRTRNPNVLIGAAPLIVWAAPLILRGPAPYLRDRHAPEQYSFPYKYWFISQIFLHLFALKTFCS